MSPSVSRSVFPSVRLALVKAKGVDIGNGAKTNVHHGRVTGGSGVNGFGRKYGSHISDKQSARAVLARGISSLAMRVMIRNTRSVQKRPKGQMNVFLTGAQASLVKTKDKMHTAGKANLIKECLLFF